MPTTKKTKGVVGEPMSARRREVLDTAARLFHERGYQGTSMDEIADAVGLTKGSLYHHFAGKTEILAAIYEEAADLVLAHVHKHADGGEPAVVLRELIHDILELVADHRYHVTVYYQEMRWVREWLPEADAARVRRKVRTYMDFVEGVVRRGVEDGSFAPIDAKVAAYSVIGMASWAYQWFDPRGRVGVDGVAEIFADIALRGLTPR